MPELNLAPLATKIQYKTIAIAPLFLRKSSSSYYPPSPTSTAAQSDIQAMYNRPDFKLSTYADATYGYYMSKAIPGLKIESSSLHSQEDTCRAEDDAFTCGSNRRMKSVTRIPQSQLDAVTKSEFEH